MTLYSFSTTFQDWLELPSLLARSKIRCTYRIHERHEFEFDGHAEIDMSELLIRSLL